MVLCRKWLFLLYNGLSKLEMLLCSDVNFSYTSEVEVLIVVSPLHASVHDLMYSG
jgi:hypothetical protein